MEHVKTVMWCATLWQWTVTSELICGTLLSQGPNHQTCEIIEGEILLMGKSNKSLLVAMCGHWDVHCFLFCFIACTNSYKVLVSMHFCNGTINYSVRHFGYSFTNHVFIQLSKLSAASAVSLSVGLSLNYSVRLVVVTYHGQGLWEWQAMQYDAHVQKEFLSLLSFLYSCEWFHIEDSSFLGYYILLTGKPLPA